MGKNIVNLVTKDNGDSFITSIFPFIAVSLFHRSSIVVSKDSNVPEYAHLGKPIKHRLDITKTIDADSNSLLIPYDPQKLIKYYLAPDTRHKHDFYSLYTSVGNALQNIKDPKQICPTTPMTGINVGKLTSSQKLDALTYTFLKAQGVPNIDSHFSSSELQMFDGISKCLDSANQSKKIINRTTARQHYSKNTLKRYLEYINIHSSVEVSINNFAQIISAVQAYIDKFNQKADGQGLVPVSNYIFNWTTNSIMKISVDTLQAKYRESNQTDLDMFINSASAMNIYSTAASIAASAINYSAKSKAYGFINRHGITGQIRSLQLKMYIESLTVFVENQYNYVQHVVSEATTNKGDQFKALSTNTIGLTNQVLKYTFYLLYLGLKEARESLSSTGDGSLSYYLKMYATKQAYEANPNELEHVTYKPYVPLLGPNAEIMKQWKDKKLHKQTLGILNGNY
jgi:hypothetical protein